MIRRHIIFSGRVQGVGFRYGAFYTARRLGLTGWVKNLYDGRVEMEVQGEPGRIEEMISMLKARRYVIITGMDVENIETVEEREFRVVG